MVGEARARDTVVGFGGVRVRDTVVAAGKGEMYCGSVVGCVRVCVVREARVLWFDVRRTVFRR